MNTVHFAYELGRSEDLSNICAVIMIVVKVKWMFRYGV